MYFDTFIARDNCIVDIEVLQQHPNVKRFIPLPRSWVLYEFHHELFKEPDFLVEGVWWQKMERFPELRQARIEMLNEERSLLAPWYAQTRKIGDADSLLSSGICDYRIFTLAAMKWLVDFELPQNWGAAKEFTFSAQTAAHKAHFTVLSQLLDEWVAASSGALIAPAGLEPQAGGVKLHAVCERDSGHWLASLWVLLSDARWKTGVGKVVITADER